MALSPSNARDSLPPAGDGAPLVRIARLAARCLDAPRALLTRGEGGAQQLWCGAAAPAGDGALPAAGLFARVAETGEPLAATGGPAAFLGVPLRDADGGLYGVLAVLDDGPRAWSEEEVETLRDLAYAVHREVERERLETAASAFSCALAQSEARYHRLTETVMSAIFRIDAQGVFTEANRMCGEIVGRPADELLGASFLDIVAPEDRDPTMALLRARLAGSEARIRGDVSVLRPSGERRLLQINTAPVLDDRGAVVGVQGVARDVTEERVRERQFRRVERMAGVAPLLSGVCHELNNPLTSIKSFAELLLLDPRTEEDHEALDIIQREAHRAAKIVSDLRVVARQSQEQGAERETLGLNELVAQVVETRRPGLESAGIELELDLSPSLPEVCVVRSQLRQVVQHLLSNAEQAMLAQPVRRLTVRTYSGSLGASLHVEDTGTGIAEADLERIFDPFWTTRAAGEGTGLGLSVVHSIVSDHGGRIRVDSKRGRGSTFAVDLPPAAEAPRSPASSSRETAARALRLLVVDDEAPIRHSLMRYLERRGHQVEAASEGGEALRLLDRSDAAYDVILADLRMPGLNGGQFLQRLRERGDGLERRLIFITGDADSPDAERMLEGSGIPVVLKPFDLAEIAQIIETQARISLL